MSAEFTVEFDTNEGGGDNWARLQMGKRATGVYATFAEAQLELKQRAKQAGLDEKRYRIRCGSETYTEAPAIPPPARTTAEINKLADFGANPKQAFGDKKVALHLVPTILSIRAAHALKEGAGKYGPYNWRDKKVEAMTYVGAMLRHLASWVDGEEIDPDSTTGKHHLDGVAASLAILLDAMYGGQLIDNRPLPGPAGGQLMLGGVVPKSDDIPF